MNYIKLFYMLLLIVLFFCFLSWIIPEKKTTEGGDPIMEDSAYRKDLYSYKLHH